MMQSIEEVVLLLNTQLATPFIVAPKPTLNLAVVYSQPLPLISHTVRLYYRALIPVRILILHFDSIQQATQYKNNHPLAYYCLTNDVNEQGRVLICCPGQIQPIIDEVAKLVAIEGVKAEQILLKQIKDYPILSFICQKGPQHNYYRWRAYANVIQEQSPDPFFISQQIWCPPLKATVMRPLLNQAQRFWFSTALWQMTRKKQSIEQAMSFALFNQHSATDIVCILTLQIEHRLQTKQGDIIIYFYLISDILFNSQTSLYRKLFVLILPKAIYSFSLVANSSDKEIIEGLIRLWTEKYVFEESFLKGLSFLLKYSKSVNQQKQTQMNNRKCFNAQMRDLQHTCLEKGIPFWWSNVNESKRLLKELKKIEIGSEKEPSLSKYDGQEINSRDFAKIKDNCNTIICGSLPLDRLFAP